MAGVKFTRESAERIGDAVRYVEGQQQASTAGQRGGGSMTQWDQVLRGVTDSAHNKGADGTVSIYSGDTWHTLTDTGDNVTARNEMGNIGSGKKVYVFTFPWGYGVIAAEC